MSPRAFARVPDLAGLLLDGDGADHRHVAGHHPARGHSSLPAVPSVKAVPLWPAWHEFSLSSSLGGGRTRLGPLRRWSQSHIPWHRFGPGPHARHVDGCRRQVRGPLEGDSCSGPLCGRRCSSSSTGPWSCGDAPHRTRAVAKRMGGSSNVVSPANLSALGVGAVWRAVSWSSRADVLANSSGWRESIAQPRGSRRELGAERHLASNFRASRRRSPRESLPEPSLEVTLVALARHKLGLVAPEHAAYRRHSLAGQPTVCPTQHLHAPPPPFRIARPRASRSSRTETEVGRARKGAVCAHTSAMRDRVCRNTRARTSALRLGRSGGSVRERSDRRCPRAHRRASASRVPARVPSPRRSLAA